VSGLAGATTNQAARSIIAEINCIIISDFEPSIALHINRQNSRLAEHGFLCHVIIYCLQFALPIILDELAAISWEALAKSPELTVRFCLKRHAVTGVVSKQPQFNAANLW
jgi:hypothetical protein